LECGNSVTAFLFSLDSGQAALNKGLQKANDGVKQIAGVDFSYKAESKPQHSKLERFI